MLILGILGHLLQLAATVVGVVGDTWDSKKRGLRRLTATGRVAIAVALCGVALASLTTVSEHLEQRRRVEAATDEIYESAAILSQPFRLMLWQLNGESFVSTSSTV